MKTRYSRRQFFAALAKSASAAGVVMAVGFPKTQIHVGIDAPLSLDLDTITHWYLVYRTFGPAWGKPHYAAAVRIEEIGPMRSVVSRNMSGNPSTWNLVQAARDKNFFSETKWPNSK